MGILKTLINAIVKILVASKYNQIANVLYLTSIKLKKLY